MPYGIAEAEKWAEEMGLLVSECAVSLGRALTAYVGGARHIHDLERWMTEGGEPALLARERLEAARHLIALLRPSFSNAQVVAWLRDSRPELGGISPATALHRSTTATIYPRLNELALRYASAVLPMGVG